MGGIGGIMKKEIGKRTVVDIRQVWSRESEFSNWLISPDGLELLAKDMEIQIENPEREVYGTNFPCDIIGNLVGDEKHHVAIENQFGKTNHEHLAKLITYAATHKAMTGIWIAEEAADDHRQVIDWLNQNTSNTIAFYLVELRAYSINGSPPAPMLDIVCKPNVSMKQDNAPISDAEKRRNEWRLAFWEDIHQELKTTQLPFNLQKPGTDHWSSISVGRSNFYISMLLIPKNQAIGIEVVIKTPWKDSAFKQLRTQASEIHSELGLDLDWRPMLEKISARILLTEKLDPSQETNRRKVCEWFKLWTPKIYNSFQHRIKELEEPE